MLVITLLVALLFIYLFVGDLRQKRQRSPKKQGANQLQLDSPQTLQYYDDRYPQRHHGPIFSPDRRYIWDDYNGRWMPNNGGFNIGFFLGLVIGIAILVVVYSG
jgi:hypothetical protein